MILDSEEQRQVLLIALQNAGFAGVNKVLVGGVQVAVERAQVATLAPPAVVSADASVNA